MEKENKEREKREMRPRKKSIKPKNTKIVKAVNNKRKSPMPVHFKTMMMYIFTMGISMRNLRKVGLPVGHAHAVVSLTILVQELTMTSAFASLNCRFILLCAVTKSNKKLFIVNTTYI